jgi:hypothetical protein
VRSECLDLAITRDAFSRAFGTAVTVASAESLRACRPERENMYVVDNIDG